MKDQRTCADEVVSTPINVSAAKKFVAGESRIADSGNHGGYCHNPDFTFQIIVPVYNEERTLESVLAYALEHDYLRNVVFVDDASTDSSLEILSRWAINHGARVLSLKINRKKEGAIRATLEILERESMLAPYTVILDSDSLIDRSQQQGSTVESQMIQAIAYMRSQHYQAMAFRIEAISEKSWNVLHWGAFADYSAMQFDQWLVGKQNQLWVINGPGGIFCSQHLLLILRSIVPDFETGDLLITVELMKRGQPIAFYPDLSVRTYVPTDLRTYFNQRRRWERGTTKVLWNERRFYVNLLTRPSLLSLAMFIHLSMYLGFIAMALTYLSSPLTFQASLEVIAASLAFWFGISLLKGIWLVRCRPTFPLKKYVLCAFVNSFVWALITTPARITGFFEATSHLFIRRAVTFIVPHIAFDDVVWLRRSIHRPTPSA